MIRQFLIDNLPSWSLAVWMVPACLLYAALALYTCGWLKERQGWRTGYTRKLFHFDIFLLAGVVQAVWGYPGTILFGSAVSLVIFYALLQGSGHRMYEAMAREKDAPYRTRYIVYPYLATLFGGLTTNFLFGPEAAVFGYLVTGVGDAIAEPVGLRYGRHRYRVPSGEGVISYRSWEGSAAVLVGSFAALLAGALLYGYAFDMRGAAVFVAVAVIAALSEAVSPHGWDNFILQVVTALSVYLLVIA